MNLSAGLRNMEKIGKIFPNIFIIKLQSNACRSSRIHKDLLKRGTGQIRKMRFFLIGLKYMDQQNGLNALTYLLEDAESNVGNDG